MSCNTAKGTNPLRLNIQGINKDVSGLLQYRERDKPFAALYPTRLEDDGLPLLQYRERDKPFAAEGRPYS